VEHGRVSVYIQQARFSNVPRGEGQKSRRENVALARDKHYPVSIADFESAVHGSSLNLTGRQAIPAHPVQGNSPIGHDARNYAQMRAAEAALSEELRASGVDAARTFITGPQAERIVERSDAIRADLIRFGLEHIRPRFDVVGAISTTIWRASCPVLIVPGPA
jgi:hypothetical protein